MDKFFTRLISLRWFLGIGLILLSLGLSPFAGKAFIPNNSLKLWFLETDPLIQHYNAYQEIFGNDEIVIVMLEQKSGVLDQEFLAKLEGFQDKVRSIPGVDQVSSIQTAQDAFDGPNGIEFEKVISQTKVSAETKSRILSNQNLLHRLIDSKARKTLVLIQMKQSDEFEAMRDAVVSAIYLAVDEHFKDQNPMLGGIGVIFSGLNLLTQQDLATVAGAGYLMMFVILGIVFRSIRFIFFTLLIVLVSVLVTMGIMGLVGLQMNTITVLLPTIIMVLGIADAIHFPSHFHLALRQSPNEDKKILMHVVLKKVFVPCLLTSLTTATGFLALCNTPMAVIRELGIFSGLGIMIAFFTSAVLMSIFFVDLNKNLRPSEKQWIHKLLLRIRGLVENRGTIITLCTIFLIGLSFFSVWNINADSYTLGYLPDHHRVVKDHHQLEKEWGFYIPLEFTLAQTDEGYIENSEMMIALHNFVTEVETHPNIRNSFSLANIYQRTAVVLDPNHKGHLSEDQFAQIKFVLDSQDLSWDREQEEFTENFLAPVINDTKDMLRITFSAKMTTAAQAGVIIEDVVAIGKKHFGAQYSLQSSGYLPLYVKIVDYAVQSQISSFYLALLLIFSLMFIWLKSLRLALISLIPNLLPVGVMFCFMYLFQIDLDISTATIAAIVIGVSIDDTIHFLYHWRQGELKGLSWQQCLTETFDSVGHAAVITSLVLVLSYPLLMLAQVKTVVNFGLLTTLTAAAALIADLFVLPTILRFVHPKSESI